MLTDSLVGEHPKQFTGRRSAVQRLEMPFIAWYLNISLAHALVMDISFALFYVVYAFVFNWSYDRVFPLPEWKSQQDAA